MGADSRPPTARRAHLLHGALRGLARREGHEGVAAVGARHGVHHEAQVPDGAAALEQRDELVLVHVFGDLPAEHLAAGARRTAFPPGRRPSVLALTCGSRITHDTEICYPDYHRISVRLLGLLITLIRHNVT